LTQASTTASVDRPIKATSQDTSQGTVKGTVKGTHPDQLWLSYQFFKVLKCEPFKIHPPFFQLGCEPALAELMFFSFFLFCFFCFFIVRPCTSTVLQIQSKAQKLHCYDSNIDLLMKADIKCGAANSIIEYHRLEIAGRHASLRF
jgi:hypothetical protein